MKNVFKYKGVTIHRGDYEGLPCPMNTSKMTDDKMQKITETIYNVLHNEYGFSDDFIKKYFNGICDSNSTCLSYYENGNYDNIDEAFWREMEEVAIAYGMTYYEDED